jgi:predicted RNA-binding protein with TRAM domain
MSYSYSRRRSFNRFGSSGPRFNMKKPVEVDKEYEAEIQDISRRGDGIARIEGFVIFVPDTKQGEQVKFKVTRVGSRFAIGELVQA